MKRHRSGHIELTDQNTEQLFGGEVQHSPGWYEKRVKDEYLPTHMMRTWLKSDIGDDWDSTCNDEENIATYYECWERHDWMKARKPDYYGIMLKEMKSDDDTLYARFVRGFEDDLEKEEKYYDDMLERMGRDLLYGKGDVIYKLIKKIRVSDQKPLQSKARAKSIKIDQSVMKDTDRVVQEDEKFFLYNDRGGSREDWKKETNHHGVVLSYLESLKNKIKHIVAEEIKIVNLLQKAHQKRLSMLMDTHKTEVDELWINRHTLRTIKDQLEYIGKAKDLSESAKASLLEDEKYAEKMKAIMGLKRNKQKDLTGLE